MSSVLRIVDDFARSSRRLAMIWACRSGASDSLRYEVAWRSTSSKFVWFLISFPLLRGVKAALHRMGVHAKLDARDLIVLRNHDA